MRLIDALKELNTTDICYGLVSDGAADWELDNLIKAIEEADSDEAEYSIQWLNENTWTLNKVTSDGTLETTPSYKFKPVDHTSN